MSDVFSAYLNGAGIFLIMGYVLGASGVEWYIYPISVMGICMIVAGHYHERKA